jgi:hypothetical protein
MLLNIHKLEAEHQAMCSDVIIYTGPTVDELPLSIDGIYLNVQLEENVVERIRCFVDKKLLKCDNSTAGQPRRWYTRRYTHGFYAYLSDSLKYEPIGTTKFHCATGPRVAGCKNTHLNWNPAKCDSYYVASIMEDYLQIPAGDLLDATVSRIDLALDVPKARIDDQAFSWPKMQQVENRYSNGRTMYLGARAGATRLIIYDKKAEIHQTSKKMGSYLEHLHEPVPVHDLMRIEIRLKKLSMPLSELITLPNPFVKLAVQVRATDFTPLESSRYDLALHEDLARASSSSRSCHRRRGTFWNLRN